MRRPQKDGELYKTNTKQINPVKTQSKSVHTISDCVSLCLNTDSFIRVATIIDC